MTKLEWLPIECFEFKRHNWRWYCSIKYNHTTYTRSGKTKERARKNLLLHVNGSLDHSMLNTRVSFSEPPLEFEEIKITPKIYSKKTLIRKMKIILWGNNIKRIYPSKL